MSDETPTLLDIHDTRDRGGIADALLWRTTWMEALFASIKRAAEAQTDDREEMEALAQLGEELARQSDTLAKRWQRLDAPRIAEHAEEKIREIHREANGGADHG